MNEAEFQLIFADAHAALVRIVKDAFPTAKVLDRDAIVGTEEDSVWLGRIRDANDKVNCWTVSLTGVNALAEASAVATDTYRMTFRIVGYYEYEFGTNLSNSTKDFTNAVNSLRFALRNNRTLGEQTFVCDHSGLNDQTILARIDTQPVHICRADLYVYTDPIPYTYQ